MVFTSPLLVPLTALLAAWVSTGLLGLRRPAPGPRRSRGGRRAASSGAALAEGLGLSIGFLAGFVAFARGVPVLQPVAQAAVGTVAVASLALAPVFWLTARAALWVFGPAGLSRLVASGLAAAGAGGAAVWVAAGPELAFASDADLAGTSFEAAAAMALAFRLRGLAAAGAALPVLGVAALSLAAVAWIDHAGPYVALGLALAAAGFGATGWRATTQGGRRRTSAEAAAGAAPDPGLGAAVAAVLFAGLAAGLIRNAPVPPWGLALVAFCFFPEIAAARIRAFVRKTKRGAEMQRTGRYGRQSGLVLAALAFLPGLAAPVAAAVLAAVLASGP